MPSRASVQRLLSALTQGITDPLISKARADRLVAPWDQPSLMRPPWQARMQGFKAGATAAALRLNSSPLQIATAIGAPYLKTAGLAGRAVERLPSASTALEGLGDLARRVLRRTPKTAAAPVATAALDSRITGLAPRALTRSPMELLKEDASRRYRRTRSI